jgi:hypothetical protein
MPKAKKEAAKEVLETTNTEAGPETSVEPVQLTIADMQAAANIIDLASRRGAFHAKEMSTVGNAYNKLNAFLEHIAATQAPAEGTEEAAESTEAAPAE